MMDRQIDSVSAAVLVGDEADHVFLIVDMSAVHGPGMGRARVFDDFRSAKFGLDHALASIARGRRRTRSLTIFLRKCDTVPRKLIVRSTS